MRVHTWVFVVSLFMPTPGQSQTTCGNKVCEPGETCNTCASDCGNCCGDGVCDPELEDSAGCHYDCGPGDGPCDLQPCEGPDCVQVCDLKENCMGADCLLPATCKPAEVSECGDGACDVGKKETCENCEADCGPCPPACGDGICDESETCESCPVDCGACTPVCSGAQCNTCIEPTQTVPTIGVVKKLSPLLLASPKVFQTGIELAASGSLKGSFKTSDSCSGKVGATGGLSVCTKLTGRSHCLGVSLKGAGSCKTKRICKTPPNYECDLENACCKAGIGGSISYGESLDLGTLSFGPLKCTAKAKMTVTGNLNIGEVQYGLSETCPYKVSEMTQTISMAAGGVGTASLKLFGQKFATGVSIEACAQAFTKNNALTGAAGASWNFKKLQAGFLNIGGWSFTASKGGTCG